MRRNGLLGIIAGLALVVGGCGGGDDDNNQQQDAGQHDVMQFDTNNAGDVQQDTGPVSDNNDTFEQAAQMDFTTNYQKSGVINPAGDLDYYKFDAAAGDWVFIFTDANAECDGTNMDTVVTLYDSSHNQVAWNDNPSQTCDSSLTYHVPTAGTYYVMVEDYSHYISTNEADWNGGPTFTYKLYIMKLLAGDDGVVADTEPNNDIAAANSFTLPTDAYWNLIGTPSGASDVDVFKFTLAAPTSVWLTFDPWGVDGSGSTSSLGLTYLTDGAGTTVIGRFDGTAGPGAHELSPPLLAAGDYALWVKPPTTALGANPFYSAMIIGFTEDNPPEAEAATATGANDTRANAELLSPTDGRAYILLHLPDGDTDWLKMPVTQGNQFAVNCGSATSGSGVQGLTVNVENEAGTAVGSCTENFDDETIGCGMGWETDINVPATGFYYLKFTKTGQVADVAANFVRCVIVSTVFES